MAASPFPAGAPFVSAFLSSISQSLSKHVGSSNPAWKPIGAASALALGLSWTASGASVVSEKMGAGLEAGFRGGISPFPCVFGGGFASLSVASPLGDAVEPHTGVVFAGESAEGKELTGIGLRKKTVLGLKSITVYAYGVYADPESLKSSLGGKYEGIAPAELSGKEELFEDVSKADVGLTVRLVIVYGRLKIGSIRSAFGESVGKGLKKFSGEDNQELLGRFTSIFTDDLSLPKGTTIDLTRRPGQVLQTKIDGEEIGSIESPLLCQALFDLYLGEDAFDKGAKQAIGRSFASLVSN